MSKHKTGGTKRAFATGCLCGWIVAWILAGPVFRYWIMAWRGENQQLPQRGYIVGYMDRFYGRELTKERSKDALKLFEELRNKINK